MELPKTSEVPSNIAGTQNKITGLQLAGGRVHWEHFGPGEKDVGYIFKKNHGFQLAVDPDQLKSLGVTMDVLMDCVKQLEELGGPEAIKGSIALRTNPGYLPNGLVITSGVDPRVKMSVMFHDPDYEDTDFLLAWFIDNEHLDHEMKTDSPAYQPQRPVDAEEMGPAQAQKQREAIKESAEAEKAFKVFDKNSSKKKELGIFKGSDKDVAIKKARKMFWLPTSSFEAEELHGDVPATAEAILGLDESVRYENLVDKIRTDKPEYMTEDFFSIYLKPGLDEEALAEKISSLLDIEVDVGKNQLHLYTDERDDMKRAVKIIGERNIKKLPDFPDLIPSGMTPLFPKKKQESMNESKQLSETGEPDQDYDHEHYDAIVKALAKEGIKAKHREFDKYQGIYLDLSKGGKNLGKYFEVESYVIGQAKPKTAKYSKAELIDADGTAYSANSGDYFQMKPNDSFEGSLLVLTDHDGKETQIENPKKKDLPHSNDVDGGIDFEGEPDSVSVFAKERSGEDGPKAEVIVSADGKHADVSELVDLVNQQSESKEIKGTSVMEGNKKVQVTYEEKFQDANSMSFESVDFWGLPKTLAEDDYVHVGQAIAKPSTKEGTEYGQKAAGKPEYSKSVKEFDSEEAKLQAKMGSNETKMKHVQPGDEIEKPKSSYGTEYGQKELNYSKNVKVGKPGEDHGDHAEGTGAADTDGKQFDDVAKNKIKLGKPGEMHGDHVEEAKKLKGKKLVKERMKMPLKKKRMKAEGVEDSSEHETMGASPALPKKPVMGRMEHLKKRFEHAKKAYEAAQKAGNTTEARYVARQTQYEWQKKKSMKPAGN